MRSLTVECASTRSQAQAEEATALTTAERNKRTQGKNVFSYHRMCSLTIIEEATALTTAERNKRTQGKILLL